MSTPMQPMPAAALTCAATQQHTDMNVSPIELTPEALDRRRWLKESLLLPMPDRLYLRLRYRREFGVWPDYRNPVHFNEWTHVHILSQRTPLMREVANKVSCKDFVARVVGPQHVVPTLATWSGRERAPFERLQQPCVIKDANGAGRNIFLRQGLRDGAAEVQGLLDEWARHPYWRREREWAYRAEAPAFLAEAFLDAGNDWVPPDYKIYTFGGRPEFIQLDRNRYRNHTRNLYSLDWKKLPYRITKSGHEADPRPARLDEMLALSRTLSQGFVFLRTDFYIVGDQLYVGELTNYSGAGLEHIGPPEFSRHLGDLWREAARASTEDAGAVQAVAS